MLIESIISNNTTSIRQELQEKLTRIIKKRLEEKRFEIIQKEFGFLNERIIAKHTKKSFDPTKDYNQKVTLAKKFVTQPVYKNPTNTKKPKNTNNLKPVGYKRIGGKLVQMSSMEKFKRRATKHKANITASQHVGVAVRKRQQTNQRKKALGIQKHATH